MLQRTGKLLLNMCHRPGFVSLALIWRNNKCAVGNKRESFLE